MSGKFLVILCTWDPFKKYISSKIVKDQNSLYY